MFLDACAAIRFPTRIGFPIWSACLSILPFVTFALLSGCNRKEPPDNAPKPVEVTVSTAVIRQVVEFQDFTGRIEAVARVDVRAQVKGYLQKVKFIEGGEVKKDDVLFEIDPRVYQAEFDRAEASVAQATGRLTRVKTEYDRAVELRSSNSIAKQEFDKFAGDYSEASAAKKLAEANLDLAKVNLSFTKVKAPISGTASRTMLDEGNLVKADDMILTTIVAHDTVHANFDVDGRSVPRVYQLIRERKVGSEADSEAPVLLALPDDDEFTQVGSINFVDNKIDPATGTLRVRGRFKNPNGLLTPGLFVRVRLPIGAFHRAVIVAEQAIASDQETKFVYVVDSNDVVSPRKIKVGPLLKSYRVIDDGLQEGERIVVSGLQRVRKGTKVDPHIEEVPPEAGLTRMFDTLRSQLAHHRNGSPAGKAVATSP